MKETDQRGTATNFTYDNRGLTTTRIAIGGGVAGTSDTFVYDALNRVTHMTRNAIPFADDVHTGLYLDQRHVTAVPTAPEVICDYDYDDHRRILFIANSGVYNGQTSPKARFDYTYDGVGNRLTTMITNHVIPDDTITYTYDALGRRIQAIDATGTSADLYFYDGQRVLAEYDALYPNVGGGTLERYFIDGPVRTPRRQAQPASPGGQEPPPRPGTRVIRAKTDSRGSPLTLLPCGDPARTPRRPTNGNTRAPNGQRAMRQTKPTRSGPRLLRSGLPAAPTVRKRPTTTRQRQTKPKNPRTTPKTQTLFPKPPCAKRSHRDLNRNCQGAAPRAAVDKRPIPAPSVPRSKNPYKPSDRSHNMTRIRTVSLIALLQTCALAAEPSTPKADKPETADALHNVLALVPGVYNGSAPENDAGFDALTKLGIKTIISVDGAPPDTTRAAAHKIRYVHLPIGYDTIEDAHGLRLMRAVRDLPRPLYIHCFHGKHRSPAATAYALAGLGELTREQAVALMRKIGTSPRYTGLYDAVRNLKPVAPARLDAVRADFRDHADVSPLVATMAAITRCYERLEHLRDAGWRPTEAHPDLDPAHEAKVLVSLFDQLTHLEGQPAAPDYRTFLRNAEHTAKTVQSAISSKDTAAATEHLATLKQKCRTCHSSFRD